MFVPEYHSQRPLGTVSKVTLRSLQLKWAAQKQAEAAVTEQEESNKEAVAAEKRRLRQRKEEIRRQAIAQREVFMRARIDAVLALFLLVSFPPFTH